ncbi:MAG: flagellar assembly peptidoglycan hydrolase FlgJ [Spongiibacteraceae bacterium]|nr:flagellar assembly peptidoglycan hydrolase FlgJ [Spongiibacteraceae bacterium]
MINSSFSTTQASNNAYTDLSSVHAIRSTGLQDKGRALEEISKQFESMLVRMMLKSMRDANATFAEGNYLSSHEADSYQQMYDDQLALSLSQGKGMGIAEIMAKQLKQRFDDSEPSSLALSRVETASKPTVSRPTTNKDIKQTSNEIAKSSTFDGSVKSFVDKVYPLAQEAAKELGIEPKVLIAQAALETGWGRKITQAANTDSSFNLFNIKADSRWEGESVAVPTIEFREGLPVKEYAAFRRYSSPAESFNDYVAFVKNNTRYSDAVASTDSESYIQHLSKAGYATDPNYADKVMKIANSKQLKEAIEQARGKNDNPSIQVLSQR